MPRKKTQKKSAAPARGPKKQPVEFADGKDHLVEESKEAQNLERLLAGNKASPFQTENASEFESRLEGMNLTEMQEIAVKAGVFPSGTKMTLKGKLRKAFKQYSLGSSRIVQVTKPILDPESEAGRAFLKLSKGQ